VNRVNSLSRYLDSGLSLGWWWLFVYGVLTVVVIAVLLGDLFLSLAASVVTTGLQLFRRMCYGQSSTARETQRQTH
jgi:hypothetical protein